MDNITHSLFALTLARTRLGRGRGAPAALLLASNAPDVDIVTAYQSAANYMKWHRGPTHGPLGIVGLGLATAAIVWGVDRWMHPRRGKPAADGPPGATPFARLAAIAMLGALCHVLMDLPTSYGTRLLSPFDWHWYAVDWMPIIDIYLLMALAAGLVFGHLTPDVRRHNVAIALALMAGNYAVRGVAHHRALALAPRVFGPTLARPCAGTTGGGLIERWPRAEVANDGTGRRCLVEMAAMPTFFSPLRWRLVARFSNAYDLQDVDVLDRRFLQSPGASEVLWRTSIRLPNQWTPAVFAAARTPIARTFLGFSRFPSARTFVDDQGVTTIRWTDVRFAGGLVSLSQAPPRPAPFAVVVQVDAGNQVVIDRLER